MASSDDTRIRGAGLEEVKQRIRIMKNFHTEHKRFWFRNPETQKGKRKEEKEKREIKLSGILFVVDALIMNI